MILKSIILSLFLIGCYPRHSVTINKDRSSQVLYVQCLQKNLTSCNVQKERCLYDNTTTEFECRYSHGVCGNTVRKICMGVQYD